MHSLFIVRLSFLSWLIKPDVIGRIYSLLLLACESVGHVMPSNHLS